MTLWVAPVSEHLLRNRVPDPVKNAHVLDFLFGLLCHTSLTSPMTAGDWAKRPLGHPFPGLPLVWRSAEEGLRSSASVCLQPSQHPSSVVRKFLLLSSLRSSGCSEICLPVPRGLVYRCGCGRLNVCLRERIMRFGIWTF